MCDRSINNLHGLKLNGFTENWIRQEKVCVCFSAVGVCVSVYITVCVVFEQAEVLHVVRRYTNSQLFKQKLIPAV